MTAHVALLRAVNLGSHNKVAMAELRKVAERLGLEDVKTLLLSGNLVFRAKGKTTSELESLLEAATKKKLGVDTDFFVRTAGEWRAIVAGNPFPKEAKADPSHLLLLCLKDAPGRARVAALEAAISGREVVRAKGRCLYAVYPDGIGRSRLTAAVIEGKLGTSGTARNWNTVLKLGVLLGDDA
jgi:uncharacterized protein (DUF1697 family)